MKYLMFLVIAFQFSAGLSYAILTLKWKVRPNRVTWWLWALAPAIWVTATLSKWFTWSVFPVIIAWLNPFMIFVSSFFNKKSYWKLWKIDYVCLALSLFATLLWWITKNPLYAVIFSVIADVFAWIPTIIKVYKYPETEKQYLFLIWWLSAFLWLLNVKSWEMVEYLFPLSLFTLSFIINLMFIYNYVTRKRKTY